MSPDRSPRTPRIRRDSAMTRCPAARNAKGGPCRRKGCTCRCSEGTSVCRCCALDAGVTFADTLTTLRSAVMGDRSLRGRGPAVAKIAELEDRILTIVGEKTIQRSRNWARGDFVRREVAR